MNWNYFPFGLSSFHCCFYPKQRFQLSFTFTLRNLVTLLISYLFHWTWNKDYIVWPLLQLDLLHTLTYRPTPRTKLITGFVTRLTRRVPLVEQEMLTLQGHLGSPLVYSGVRITRSLDLCVCFVDHCLSFCTFFWPLWCLFFFNIRILITTLVSSSSSFKHMFSRLLKRCEGK